MSHIAAVAASSLLACSSSSQLTHHSRTSRIMRTGSGLALTMLMAGMAVMAHASESTIYSENASYYYGNQPMQTESSSTINSAASGLGQTLTDGTANFMQFNGTAYQTPTGVNVYHNSATGIGTYSVNSMYTVTKTYVNTGTTALDLAYNLNIFDSGLYNKAGTYNSGDFVSATLNYNLSTGGTSLWSSGATLRTDSTGTQLSTTGTDLGYYNNGGFSNALGTYYKADDVTELISLGSLAAGESMTVAYTLSAIVAGENSGGVLTSMSGDCSTGIFYGSCPNGSWAGADGVPPFNAALQADGFVVTSVASAVPEVANWMLMLGGLVLVGMAARRRIGQQATGEFSHLSA